MFNEFLRLLADVPPMLVTAWAVWLGAGALLVMWFRRAKYEVEFPAPAPKPASARPKPVARPSSSPDMQTSVTHTDAAAEQHKPAPLVVGDPFGDLATLLDQPSAAATTEPRAPADSPILSSSGSPIRRANNNDSNPVA